MCTINFWFIPGARGINRKLEKTNSASMGKFRSTGHIVHDVMRQLYFMLRLVNHKIIMT